MEKLELMFGGKETPISIKVAKYYYDFFLKNILVEKNIIINSNYHVLLGLTFFLPAKYGPKGLYVFKPSKVGNDRGYVIRLPLEQIIESTNPQQMIIEIIFQGLMLFFIQTYKKITPEYMDELWERVDWDYLLSIPYPPLEADLVIFGKELSKQ